MTRADIESLRVLEAELGAICDRLGDLLSSVETDKKTKARREVLTAISDSCKAAKPKTKPKKQGK